MNRWSMPGIRRIYTIPAKLLPEDVQLTAKAGYTLVINSFYLKEIETEGGATCEVTRSNERGEETEKSTLTFRSAEETETEGMAYVVESVMVGCYLIGQKEKPYPLVEKAASTGEPGGEARVKTYTVSFAGSSAMTRCEII